jgi:hypothetical protein
MPYGKFIDAKAASAFYEPIKKGQAMQVDDWIIHPYSRMDHGQLKAKLVAECAESLRRMPELCEEIRGLLQRRYPLHVLAVLAGYGLQSTVTAEGSLLDG